MTPVHVITVRGFLNAAILASLVPTPPTSAQTATPKIDMSALPAAVSGPIDFTQDIEPIFAKHCYKCHGPEKQKAGLRLDVSMDALRGSDAGVVIVPGKSAESILIHNVAGLDPDLIMPPEDEGERLSKEEVARLRAWIDAGAVWPKDADAAAAKKSDHWSFQEPVLPSVPAVGDSTWPRTPVDAFVLARLEHEKMKPSPEADRVTLARRLSQDLLGLPPTPEEVTRFVNDARPDAYERFVDGLLASPHFGERWARHWLDLARYADSDGYERDNPRPYAYLFRDWVIDAINRDLPFDQFTIEQLAGDLLPDATEAQKIATGFHRQTLTNRENGVDQEEFRIKAIVDRASTTGAVWLGLTVACAECHTHKYDPITQREFYQLFAFFNDASEKDVPAPQPAEVSRFERDLAAWTSQLKTLEGALDSERGSPLATRQAEWERNVVVPLTRWTVLPPSKVATETDNEEKSLKPAKDHSISPAAKDKAGLSFKIEATLGLGVVTAFRLEALHEPGKPVGRGEGGDFELTELSVKVRRPGEEPVTIPLASARADYDAPGREAAKAIDADPDTGWSIGAKTHQSHAIVFQIKAPLELPPEATLIFNVEQRGKGGLIDRFRLSATTSSGAIDPVTIPDNVVAALATDEPSRTPEQRAEIERYYFEQIDPHGRELTQQMSVHQAARPKAPETKAAILVAEERKTHVHIRGDFLRKGDPVPPATLAVLHPFKPRGERADRLDLARWIVAPENPLTARVAVNQVWKNLFGRALVSTTDDFGLRGEQPSHPELLDWLAIVFSSPAGAPPGLGWSRKALIRLLVNSATYRQNSHARPGLRERDPNNTLLARQNRFRLEAELVRDAFLASSGLLNPAIGGPSIRPRLPAELGPGYFSSVTWKPSEGADQYRRGLYIFFQRTLPYPALMAFDAPDSNAACTRRERSNTPLQALTLLNDPVFFECAQALGIRVGREPGNTDDKLRRAFQLCLSRPPTTVEMAHLRELYQGEWKLLRGAPATAKQVVGNEVSGETAVDLAVWVVVCRALMNLDEFVTRE